jgi:hypothetical protein
MYRRILLVVVLGLLTSACVPYGGGSYYQTEVYTVDRYPAGGYYPYSRGYYSPPPRYYVAPAPRYYVAPPPPRYFGGPPGPHYRPGPPPGYRGHPGGPDPRWRGGPSRYSGQDRDRGDRPGRGWHR